MDNLQTAQAVFGSMHAASLGTLDTNGAPFVSLVTVAKSGSSPVMLLSGLAAHTKNLASDNRCSLLIVAPGGEGENPLEGPRLTLVGSAVKLERGADEAERAAFLEQHPSAVMYVDFGDFAFFRFEIESSQLVAGFGRIEKFDADQLAN